MAHRHQRQPAAWPHVERDRRAQPHGRGNKRLRATRSCQLGGTLAVGPAARRLGPPRREQLNRRAAALPALRAADTSSVLLHQDGGARETGRSMLARKPRP